MSGPGEEYKVDTPDDNDCAHNDRVTEECQEESSVTKWIYRVGQHKETSSKRSQMVTLAHYILWVGTFRQLGLNINQEKDKI